MRAIRFFSALCLLLAVAVGVLVWAAWRPALAPIEPPSSASFNAALVQRGAELAALGNCGVCHTAPGGRIFAGGLAVPTPFGTVYSTNITPDAETGIGTWSEPAFRRAMGEGVRRDGRYLYPAFPYDHFTLVSDADDGALYAFLMTREPVRANARRNRLRFPLNVRLVMFGWNLLFLHRGPYRADPAHDQEWNRGAYLAQGLGHCGSCHTPRNFLGAENGATFAGGSVDGWTAYALDASAPAPEPWTAAALAGYLHRGFEPAHGVAQGPMAQVTRELGTVPDDDVRAIASFVAAQMGPVRAPSPQTATEITAQSQRGKTTAPQSADSQAQTVSAEKPANNWEGELIYSGACAGCHQGSRGMPYGGIDLALSSAVAGPSAQNLLNVVVKGLPAADGVRGPIMPGFATSLDDGQLAVLAAYLRGRFSGKAPWNDVEASVRQARIRARAAMALHLPASNVTPRTAQRTIRHEAQR